VIAPAKTGKESTSKKTVTKTVQTKRPICSTETDILRKFFTVLIKLIPPKIELAPAKCNLKIAKSTELPGCPKVLKGGYTVHLVPAPVSTTIVIKIKVRDTGNAQNLKLFNRGNLISGPPNIKGISQFPKPPIIVGITIKKIIIKACAVIIELYN
jgi:hypothetical protein